MHHGDIRNKFKIDSTYCKGTSSKFHKNAAHCTSIHNLWEVNMCRLKLNTRLNTIWHTGHFVCPWCKLLWCVRESWRPNFFPQSLQTNLRASAEAVRTDEPLDQSRMSCTAQLATKGRKILQCKYTYEQIKLSRNWCQEVTKTQSNTVLFHKITQVNKVQKYPSAFINLW